MTTAGGRLRVGVLVSGRGSNLQALLDASARADYPAEVVVVISDRERAAALERARAAGVEALVVNPKDFADREAFDLALVRELTARRVDLACNAGFMRILSQAYTRAFAGRAMNIHPSLLPAFPGLHAQRQALDYGAKVAGVTVHFVDDGPVDTGPIILQASVPVLPDDTEDTLAARILNEEHRLYPEAVRLFAEGRLSVVGRRVLVRGESTGDAR
jgi:phosphoribosylglycinamide formyltransferase-1